MASQNPTRIVCEKKPFVSQAFDVKPQRVTDKAALKKLEKVAGLVKRDRYVDGKRIADGDTQWLDYKGPGDVKCYSSYVGVECGSERRIADGITAVRLAADFNQDGVKDVLCYHLIIKYQRLRLDITDGYRNLCGVLREKHAKCKPDDQPGDPKFYMRMELPIKKPVKKDPLQNLRVFDIDQDGDMDIIVSLRNPATNQIEHFKFTNRTCNAFRRVD